MNKSKSNKITVLLLLLLAVILTIGAGFANWVFESSKLPGNIGLERGGKTDEIYENYNFPQNIYTLYFFPQPAYVDGEYKGPTLNNDGSITYVPKSQDDWGFWDDSTKVEDENGKFGYKKLVVQDKPSSVELDSLGSLKTTRTDYRNYGMTFAGWTTDYKLSLEYASTTGVTGGVTPQTTPKPAFSMVYSSYYQFADFTKSMSELDNADNGPNSKAGDNIIFFYPIYTSGKNYINDFRTERGLPKISGDNDQPLVRLNNGTYDDDGKNPTESYYFQQSWGTYNGVQQGPYSSSYILGQKLEYNMSYYSLTGFRLKEGGKYYLSFNLPDTYGWTPEWRTLNWESARINDNNSLEATPMNFGLPSGYNSDDQNSENGPFFIEANSNYAENVNTYRQASSSFLKTEPGTYNIYVYMTYRLDNSLEAGTTTSDFFNNDLDPGQNNFVKTATYVRLFDNGAYTFKPGQTAYRPKVGTYTAYSLTFTVKVEKIEEPMLFNWSNSNNFRTFTNGIKMFEAGSKYGFASGDADSKIKTITTADGHGAAVRAVDYYAFNVPSIGGGTGNGDKHYVSSNTGNDNNDKWYYDNFLAFSSTTFPLSIPGSNYTGSVNYYQNLSSRELGQVNSYTRVKTKNDYELPSGTGNYWNNTAATTARTVSFSSVVPVSNVIGSGGSLVNFSLMSRPMALTYNFNNFFKPNNPADDNQFLYSENEYHIVLRFYYNEVNKKMFGNSYVVGFSAIAIPQKIRRRNVFYLIKKEDVDAGVIKRVSGTTNFIDIAGTIGAIKNRGSIYYYSEPVDRTFVDAYDGGSLNMEGSDGTAGKTFNQLLASLGATQATDYLDSSIVYKINSTTKFNFSRTRILVLE